jgi:alpha-glucosidase (family GH31 glycosyl hydrolase)
VAKNFSSLNLSVGVIVIDLGPPADPPYYRLDPARFPDVAAMAAQVKALTGGAYLMPNLKPTSVKSSDCPACDAGHSHATDGKADDGKVDASSAACRQCIWNKRLKPALFDKNVTTFWLDDDEANKFKLEGQQCKPTTPNGSPWARCRLLRPRCATRRSAPRTDVRCRVSPLFGQVPCTRR